MKNFLIAVFVLLVLIAAFSTIESRIEFEYPFGNWAVPGNTGKPTPGEGEPGNVNMFSFGSAEPEATAGAEESPISVEIVTEQQEEQQENKAPAWAFLIVYSVLLAGVYVFAVHEYFRVFCTGEL